MERLSFEMLATLASCSSCADFLTKASSVSDCFHKMSLCLCIPLQTEKFSTTYHNLFLQGRTFHPQEAARDQLTSETNS
jgi:hypothetical protein